MIEPITTPVPMTEEDSQNVARMRAVEAEFIANGLTTHLTDARAGLDLSAILSPSGRREAEIWIDEDGRVEVRYWTPEGATAEEIAGIALRALRAMAGIVGGPGSGEGATAKIA